MAQLSTVFSPTHDTDPRSRIDLREAIRTVPTVPTTGADVADRTDLADVAPVDRPSARQLGVAVLTTVTVLFGLLLALGSEQPATSLPAPASVAEGDAADVSARAVGP